MTIILKSHEVIKSQGSRILVIGDVHGQFELLSEMLSNMRYNADNDVLVSVGDLINKGPDSLACAEFFLSHPRRYIALGNHEKNLLAYAYKPTMQNECRMLQNGGAWFMYLPKLQQMQIAQSITSTVALTFTIKLKNGLTLGISHAGAAFKKWSKHGKAPVTRKYLYALTESRDLFYGRMHFKRVKGVDYTVHGHTPVDQPRLIHNSLFIDVRNYDNDKPRLCILDCSILEKGVDIADSVHTYPSD